MVIIFLDIDGVIFYNPMDGRVHDRVEARLKGRKHEFPQGYPMIEFDRAAVDLFDKTSLQYLDKLIEDAGQQTQQEVGIVLSSSWRSRRYLEDIQDLFKQHSFAQYLIDRTPELSYRKSRGDEIAHWLKKNKERYKISSFVVLDDYDCGLSENFPEAFVKFNHLKLFREEEYRQAMDILLKSS